MTVADRYVQDWANQINLYGVDVTFRSLVLTETDPVFGEQTVSYTDSTQKAIVTVVKKGDRLVDAGHLAVGDHKAVMKGSMTPVPKVRDQMTTTWDTFEVVFVDRDILIGQVAGYILALKKKVGVA